MKQKTEKQKTQEREAALRYRQSEKGKAAFAQWRRKRMQDDEYRLQHNENARKYRQSEKGLAAGRDRYHANPEKVKERERLYRAKPGVKEHKAEMHKQYRQTPEGRARVLGANKRYNEAHKAELKVWSTGYRHTDKGRRIVRANALRKYGLTLADLHELLTVHGNACAICHESFSPEIDLTPRKLLYCLDHDHATGKLRGLLCCTCNTGLGAFRDDPTRLQKAIDYLRQNEDLLVLRTAKQPYRKRRGQSDASYLLHRYGITLRDKAELLTVQGYACLCCGEDLTKNTRNHHIDHDHNTGKVRGILCSACNRGIGYFHDSPSVIQNAIDYLRQYSNTIPFPATTEVPATQDATDLAKSMFTLLRRSVHVA